MISSNVSFAQMSQEIKEFWLLKRLVIYSCQCLALIAGELEVFTVLSGKSR